MAWARRKFQQQFYDRIAQACAIFLWAMRNMLLPMHQSGAWPAGSCNRCASVSTCHMCHKAACFGCAPHAAGVHFPGGRQDLHRRAVLVAAQAVSTWVNRIGVCVVQSAVAVGVVHVVNLKTIVSVPARCSRA